MSDIIIEGKNLSDINQSNFQTVGVRSGLYFVTNPNLTEDQLDVNQSVFKYDTVDIHEARLGDDYNNDLFPMELIKHVTIEPWQGRLHYDKNFINDESTGLSLVKAFNDNIFDDIDGDDLGGLTPAEIAALMNMSSPSEEPLYYSYFYTGNIYSSDGLRYKLNNFYSQLQNDNRLGVEERESNVSIVKDDRFPLGTYTEENKQYWELQTSDPISRNSQFSSTRMQTAQSKKLQSDLIRSEEEQFSVDAFTFTERDGIVTPLFFYYDKQLHPTEYNNATTGKVNMKIELRESGRNGDNELDLYQERKVIRPFLMGFEKDELSNGGFTVGSNPEELIGIGEVYGEGLYYVDYIVTLRAIPDGNSYLIGIFDVPDDNLKSSNESYTFSMPNEDVQYLARFRPNPYIILSQRFIDEVGNVTDGGPNSKGEVRVWQSKLHYDNADGEYYVQPLSAVGGFGGGEVPPFKTGGNRFFARDLKPFDYGGEPVVIEQREITENYKFKGFTFISGSEGVEVPLPEENFLPDNDSNDIIQYAGGAYDAPGNNINSIKIIKLMEDFRYPAGRLQIYANYGLVYHIIRNLNNYVDFENNFADALKYGPFKFVVSRQEFGNLEDFSSEDETRFRTFEGNDGPIRRLLISAPGVGYVNTPTTPPIEEEPIGEPSGWTPTNPLIGTLSPQGQWIWNGFGWEENPNYDPSDYQSFSNYLPSGDNAHLTPIEETGYDFGNFVYHRLAFPNSMTFPDDAVEKIIFKGPEEGDPLSLQEVINIRSVILGDEASEDNPVYPPTYDNDPDSPTYGTNLPVRGVSHYPDPSQPEGIGGGPYDYARGVYDSTGFYAVPVNFLDAFTVTGVDEDNNDYFYIINWIPNPGFSSEQTQELREYLTSTDLRLSGNYYGLNVPERNLGYQGIQLKGYYTENAQGEPVLDLQQYGDHQGKIMEIITTEVTASISYQPLQRGVYVKVIDDGIISTLIERNIPSSMTPIRPKELSGAIDADMEGFGRSVVYDLQPSQESAPPQIAAYVAQANGQLNLSTNIHPTLDLERLGVEWNPDEWQPNSGGNFKYTAPESREATYMAGDDEISLFWKYIEFRIVVSETAEGEQSESGEAVDPNFYVGLNVFGMPGAGGQIFRDFPNDQGEMESVLVSNGGLVNLFNIEETVDGNGIPYQEFSQIPIGQRSIILRAVPSSGGFADADSVGTWSFMADPGVDVDTVGSIQQFWVGNPNDDNFEHHVAVVTFNEEGPVTVKYQWFSDDGGGP